MINKKELIKEFNDILNKLVKQNKLNYNPYRIQDLNRMKKEGIQEGINLYKPRLKNE